MKRLKLFICILLGIETFTAHAQFFSSGTDPGSIKWSRIFSPHYQVIYPSGLDSLASSYAVGLEHYYDSERLTLGFAPNEKYRRPMPVVLHGHTAEANGSVAWAPRMMNLFTAPQFNSPEPLPWQTNLVIHESRHSAQMQFGRTGAFKPFGWLFGEMFTGAMSGVFPGPLLLEGDAVVAETALTNAGRGRSAVFLNYYHTALAEGEIRSWNSWRWGSFKKFTPDHYALGYLTIAGTRTLYDDPYFMNRYFENIRRNPIRFGVMQKTVKDASGKLFKKSFDEITGHVKDDWARDESRRAPFMKSEAMAGKEKGNWYIGYRALAVAGKDTVYALRTGKRESTKLVRITGGDNSRNIHTIRVFSPNTSPLVLSPDGRTLWWSEKINDPRWSLKSASRIRYMHTDSDKINDFTKNGRFAKPAISEDGTCVAAVEYPLRGGSVLRIWDIATKTELAMFHAPDSLQMYEAVWGAEISEMFVLGLSGHGEGIYRLQLEPSLFDGRHRPVTKRQSMEEEITRMDSIVLTGLEPVAGPQAVSISNLSFYDGKLFFESDLTGVNEFYCAETHTGRRDHGNMAENTDARIFRISNNRFGGEHFAFSPDHKNLYYTVQRTGAKEIHTTAASDLPYIGTDFSDRHRYAMADKLSQQEKAARNQTREPAEAGRKDSICTQAPVQLSSPKPYRKAAHLFGLHSWAPVWFDYDDISSLSYDISSVPASLGATGLLQNKLGTMTGSVGYAWKQDKDNSGRYRHSGHLSLTYTGLYPVISLEAHVGERRAHQYWRRVYYNGTPRPAKGTTLGTLEQPYFNMRLNVYLPLDFSSGGHYRGFIPQVKYTLSNDRYSKETAFFTTTGHLFGDWVFPQFTGAAKGSNVLMQTLDFSVKAYTMRGSSEAGEYPSLGIGTQIGYKQRLGLADRYSAQFYAYIYGYLPGFARHHGLRLTGTFQHQFTDAYTFGENHFSTSPRGLQNTNADDIIAIYYSNQLKLSADYALPFSLGDIDWFSPLFYIRNFIFTPHFDCAFLAESGYESMTGSDRKRIRSLYSAGASLTAKLGNCLWLPYTTRIGVVYDYNGGNAYDAIKSAGGNLDRHYVGLLFSVDL